LTKAYETVSLGFGPLFSSTIDAYNDVVGLTIAYVHQGSPAWAAGMRRGDTIYNVNGVVLRSSNYKDYMTALYYSPSGTYNFQFIRDADMNNRFEATVSVDLYRYNPVLYSAIMTEGSHNIGYLVLENFDLDAQDFVVDILQQFKDNSITDLILDLRFNPGGAVAQSRYIASAIAGTSHLDAIFVNVDFRGNKKQSWKFRGGPNDEDGLGIAPDLGLSRLYVIGSESTASASELIINGLRGIDFPVYLYGSRTEGKNVGMTTTRTTYDNRTFLFSPITFRVSNAKGFGDYPDGIAPDVMVNNQNSSYADDADNVFPYSFGDWGNMGFNVALRYAYEDILGISRSQSVRQQSSESEFKPLEFCAPAEYKIGRYGNVIYKMED
jgi:C-terminal processing protease CtpA/Prc